MLLNPLGMYSSGGTIEGGALEELKNFKEIYTELEIDSFTEPSNIKNVQMTDVLDIQGSGALFACFSNGQGRSEYNDHVITKITIDNEIVLHSCNKFYNGFTYSQGLGIVFGNINNFLKIYSVDNVGPGGLGEIKWGTINNWDKSCTKKVDEYFINVTDIPIVFNDSIKIQTYSFCESEPRKKKYDVYVRYKLDE